MSRPKFIFIGNGSHQNRGCEAITLGTIEILRNAFGVAVSFIDIPYVRPDIPAPAWSTTIDHYQYKPTYIANRFNKGWWIRNALRFIPKLRRRYLAYVSDQFILPHIEETTAILSLGGDNYSLDYGIPYLHVFHGKFAKKHETPFFIWGASVGPFEKKPDFAQTMFSHLQNEVTGIFVREKRSYDYLKEKNVTNVQIMSDPAFVMEPEPVSTNQLGFEFPKDAIGINLSPIMYRYCYQDNIVAWQKNARKIILTIRKHFDNPIVLIPHVTIGNHNNDHVFMESCLDGIKQGEDIFSIDCRLNSPQTKWLISKLSCLIAARTHATIAAFSTCTPTVSLAYSVKAFGLNEMLFGHNDYVVPPESLNAETVVSVTQKVLSQSDGIRKQLANIMPSIRENAYRPGQWLKKRYEK